MLDPFLDKLALVALAGYCCILGAGILAHAPLLMVSISIMAVGVVAAIIIILLYIYCAITLRKGKD